MKRLIFRAWMLVAVALSSWAMPARVCAEEEQQKFPTPEFESGYTMKSMQAPGAKSQAWAVIDTALLAACLGLAAYLVYWRRSRRGVFILMLFALAYFGFYRKGCVCPIGAIQNVAAAAGPNNYALPWMVGMFFLLPILFTLFFGRVFCSSVCPLGAAQDVMLWKAVKVPAWLERALGTFAFLYLGLAVALAWVGADFIICRYDPFVGLFRLNGPAEMLVLGGMFLIACMFIGRIYCRFICPLGAIFRLISPLSWKRVTITPKECVDCRLCEEGCPFGCIRHPTPAEPMKPEKKRQQRAVLVGMLAALPALVLVFGLLGFLAARPMARIDWRVRLADATEIEKASGKRGRTDETSNFWKSGEPFDKLIENRKTIEKRFRIASTAFGGWVGLVIGMSLVGASVRRMRVGYTADAGTCVACSRCYSTCPVEHARRTGQSVESIMMASAEKKA